MENSPFSALASYVSNRLMFEQKNCVGAPNNGFLQNSLKRYFRLSEVLLKVSAVVLGCAISL